MKKRIITIFLAVTMCVNLLAGCGTAAVAGAGVVVTPSTQPTAGKLSIGEHVSGWWDAFRAEFPGAFSDWWGTPSTSPSTIPSTTPSTIPMSENYWDDIVVDEKVSDDRIREWIERLRFMKFGIEIGEENIEGRCTNIRGTSIRDLAAMLERSDIFPGNVLVTQWEIEQAKQMLPKPYDTYDDEWVAYWIISEKLDWIRAELIEELRERRGEKTSVLPSPTPSVAPTPAQTVAPPAAEPTATTPTKSGRPTTVKPAVPTPVAPTSEPSTEVTPAQPAEPTPVPTTVPTSAPTQGSTSDPTSVPSSVPTLAPSNSPAAQPSVNPV